MTMSDSLDLKGGTTETRVKLRNERTAKLIEKFMNEAETNPGNVLYKWTAIWDVLKERYLKSSDKDMLARCLNMEQYYKGVLDFECTERSENGVILRWMEQTGTSILPNFVCKLAALGCRSDDDCHIGGAGSVCYFVTVMAIAALTQKR